VSAYRVWYVRDTRKALRRMERHRPEEQRLEEGGLLTTLDDGMKTEGRLRLAALGFDTVFTILPVFGLLPTGTGGSSAVKLSKISMKTATKQTIRKTSEQDLASVQGQVLKMYRASQAFLTYLGPAREGSDTYQRWESSRMFLRQLFGVDPAVDMFKMAPTPDEVKLLVKMELDGKYDPTELEKPLLFFLFRAYNCWRSPYHESLRNLFGSAVHGREKHAESQARKFFYEDVDYIRQYFHPADPCVRRLHTLDAQAVADMLVSSAMSNPDLASWLEVPNDLEGDVSVANGLVFFSMILPGFFRAHEVWALEQDGKVKAVCLVAAPHRTHLVDGLTKADRKAMRDILGDIAYRMFSESLSRRAAATAALRSSRGNSWPITRVVFFEAYDTPQSLVHLLLALQSMDRRHSLCLKLHQQLAEQIQPGLEPFLFSHHDESDYALLTGKPTGTAYCRDC